jgi:hypothetical protein
MQFLTFGVYGLLVDHSPAIVAVSVSESGVA